jgi:hypothetical protein
MKSARDPKHRADEILTTGKQIAVAIASSQMTVEDLYDEHGLPA